MSQTLKLLATRRVASGKGGARQTRLQGRVPAVIYGHGRDPESLALAAPDFDKLLKAGATRATVVELDVEGTPVQTIIREIQRHPVRKHVMHVDFYEIHAGETLTVRVPLRLVGTAEGVRNQGGVLEQFLRDIEIEVLPRHLPDHVDVDVTDLSVAHSLHVSDISVPNAEILEDADTTICTVVPPRVEVEETAAVVEEAESAEPELIRKPREADEEAGEE